MNKCIFLDGNWTCDDCDVRKVGMCSEAFYNKYGFFNEGPYYVNKEWIGPRTRRRLKKEATAKMDGVS